MKPFELIAVAASEGVTRIELRRPPQNLMTIPMMEELAHALDQVQRKAQARLVVLRGSGACFSHGADPQDHAPDRAPALIRALHRLVESVMCTKTPILAALHGEALGEGLEVASLADVVLVADGSRLALPQIREGAFPPLAAAFYPAMIGWKNALRLLLTGEDVTAEEARQMGLVTAVLSRDGFETQVDKWISRLTSLDPAALKLGKMAAMGGFIQRPFDALTTAETLFVQELAKARRQSRSDAGDQVRFAQ